MIKIFHSFLCESVPTIYTLLRLNNDFVLASVLNKAQIHVGGDVRDIETVGNVLEFGGVF